MNFALAAHLYMAVHGRDVVLLDLRSGQYELLAGIGGHVALAPNARSLSVTDPDLAQQLQALGIFGATETSAPRPLPRRPERTAPLHSPVKSTLQDSLWMATGWADMLMRYHGRSFCYLVQTAMRRTRHGEGAALEAVSRAAVVFDQLSVWLPFQGDCLYRCYMLLRRLGPLSGEVDWVFGVRTWPFLAHCWLQAGDVALTDDAERLVMFSPILAI